MRHVASYSVRIPAPTKAAREAMGRTVREYRAAVSFLARTAQRHWACLSLQRGSNRNGALERLVHATAKNPAPLYPEFDAEFRKLPSYLRRAAVADALGMASSHRTRLEAWEADPKGRPPRMSFDSFSFPALYKPSMFSWPAGALSCRVKALVGNDWSWIELPLRKCDVDYIQARCQGRRMSNPTLERRGKVWSLRFCFEADVELCPAPEESRRVCAVDLGINAAATCCAMDPDGTVVGRASIAFPIEKDRLDRALGRIKGAQQRGARKTPRLWALANAENSAIARKTARAIVDFAALHSCDVVVFEHLEFRGRRRGSGRQRLALWRKREVQRAAASQAHLLGMRASTVCAWGTSRLAFDGSGRVLRGREIPAARGTFNAKTCMFPTGKLYDCDLNAAYNIAARYHIRAILKSLPETAGSAVRAKVPGLAGGTTRTLSSLISLRAELAAMQAAFV